MSELALKGVVKEFGQVEVIHGVDLTVDDGDFCVFVGPSGCGKSTLLRMIAGLEETTAGQMTIGERDVTHSDPARRGVAMVFQTYALYPHMSVRENMSFGLKISRAAAAEISSKVDKAARILKLEDYMERKPRALSGGQRQRVAIGRAIVREPDVFLFDEPLSNLDAELRVQMRLEIAKLHKKLGATMIYVTHDQVEAMTMADKIVVLRDGRIEQAGEPVTLYEDPDNVFVAGFIGSPRMNFLAGTVMRVEGGRAYVSLSRVGDVEVPVEVAALPSQGQRVTLGLRPEHFEEAGSVQFDLQIDVIENLGGVSYAYATIEGEELPLIIELRGKARPREGGPMKVSFDPSSALLFDHASGRRIR